MLAFSLRHVFTPIESAFEEERQTTEYTKNSNKALKAP